MELNWNDHSEQLNAQLRWQQVRNDFYGNTCYDGKNVAARERAISNGHIHGSADSMERYTAKLNEREKDVMAAQQFYHSVVCPLDAKIKQAQRDGDANSHILLLIEANDVVLEMLKMTNLAITHHEIIKNPSAVALGSVKSEKKAVAARANGSKGGRPRKTPPANI